MISYRRSDSGPITGRIYDRLRAHFGADHVFIDIDSIPMGIDYRRHIDKSMKRCDVLLPVIGPRWTGPGDDGKRRIDDPSDLVRLEVAHALERDIRVIPLLVENARMPATAELPDDLKTLRFRNALRVDSGIDFHHHIDRLCTAIEAAGHEAEPAPVARKATSGPARASTKAPQKPVEPSSISPVRPEPVVVKPSEKETSSLFGRARPVLERLKEPKWYLSLLAGAALLVVLIMAMHSMGRPSGPPAGPAPAKDEPGKKVTRIPNPKHFPPGTVGAQLVGTWKQGDVVFLFFEDGTFSTESPTKGGDDGRWDTSGRHIIASGTSHPRKKWMLTLSLDGTVLTGRMTDDLGSNEPVTLRRQ